MRFLESKLVIAAIFLLRPCRGWRQRLRLPREAEYMLGNLICDARNGPQRNLLAEHHTLTPCARLSPRDGRRAYRGFGFCPAFAGVVVGIRDRVDLKTVLSRARALSSGTWQHRGPLTEPAFRVCVVGAFPVHRCGRRRRVFLTRVVGVTAAEWAIAMSQCLRRARFTRRSVFAHVALSGAHKVLVRGITSQRWSGSLWLLLLVLVSRTPMSAQRPE